MGILKELIDYSNAVLDGKVIACKKHKWACLRFLNDLKRRGEWEWDFDERRAERYFQWMRLFKHSAGELAGQLKEPCGYELFVYGNIYGWISSKTHNRRFRKMYEQLARKQAKSQNKAIQALYEISAFGEPRAEVYVAATKKEQTRFVWGEAEWLFQNSKDNMLADKFVCKYDKQLLQTTIKHIKSGSFFARLSKDDKKSGDGANPHFCIIDEYHLHDTTEYYDLFSSGMKTRPNPLLSIITTAGFNLNNPCYRVEYDYVTKILDPDNPTENDRYFAIICEADRNETSETIITPDGREIEPGGLIDELGTEEAIMKANPVTGSNTIVRENILIETQEARDKPEKMRDVLTKTYNVWVHSKPMGYMDMAHWGDCKITRDELFNIINNKAGGRCYVGFDLSTSIDLTSIGFIFPYLDGVWKYALYSHSFIPSEKYHEKIHVTDRMPFDIWRRDGHITVTDGSVVDYTMVLQYITDICNLNGWTPVEYCFDPHNATWATNQLKSEGKEVSHIPQGALTISEPAKAFRDTVYLGRVVHDNNPVLTWAVGNALVRTNQYNSILLYKEKNTQRIDPIAAIITAFKRAMVSQSAVPADVDLEDLFDFV